MTMRIEAPFPKSHVTVVLPNPEFADAQGSQASVQIKRRMRPKAGQNAGGAITYVQANDKRTLILRWFLTRQKDLELAAFLKIFHTANWKLILHDNSEWDAQLIGEPIRRRAVDRIHDTNSSIGGESIELTMTFSAKKL